MARSQEGSVSAVERRWRDRVVEWQRSGETQRSYCARRGWSAKSLSYWFAELARRDRRRAGSAAEPSGGPALAWTEVAVPRLALASESGALELVHPRGFVVRLGTGFEEAALRRLLTVLESAPC